MEISNLNLEPLIYDRTLSDVIYVHTVTKELVNGDFTHLEEFNQGLKGAYNLFDIYRIIEWTKALADKLNSMGYSTEHEKDPDIRGLSIPQRSDIDIIRRNVVHLKENFFNMPEWREILFEDNIDYNQANAIEWDLKTCKEYIEQLSKVFIYTNQTNIASGLNWYLPYEPLKKDGKFINEVKE